LIQNGDIKLHGSEIGRGLIFSCDLFRNRDIVYKSHMPSPSGLGNGFKAFFKNLKTSEVENLG